MGQYECIQESTGIVDGVSDCDRQVISARQQPGDIFLVIIDCSRSSIIVVPPGSSIIPIIHRISRRTAGYTCDIYPSGLSITQNRNNTRRDIDSWKRVNGKTCGIRTACGIICNYKIIIALIYTSNTDGSIIRIHIVSTGIRIVPIIGNISRSTGHKTNKYGICTPS